MVVHHIYQEYGTKQRRQHQLLVQQINSFAQGTIAAFHHAGDVMGTGTVDQELMRLVALTMEMTVIRQRACFKLPQLQDQGYPQQRLPQRPPGILCPGARVAQVQLKQQSTRSQVLRLPIMLVGPRPLPTQLVRV